MELVGPFKGPFCNSSLDQYPKPKWAQSHGTDQHRAQRMYLSEGWERQKKRPR